MSKEANHEEDLTIEEKALALIISNIKIYPKDKDNVKQKKEELKKRICDLANLNYEKINKYNQTNKLEKNNDERNNVIKVVTNDIINEIDKWDLTDIQPESFIKYGRITGMLAVGCQMSTSQIRKFLYELKVLQNHYAVERDNFSRIDVYLLKIPLVYSAAKKSAVKPISKVILKIIDKIDKDKKSGYDQFNRMVKFVETVIAYHALFGGKE